MDYLRKEGASFFSAIHAACGGGYPAETVKALWDLVWRGILTNDTLHSLRAFVQPPARQRRRDRARVSIAKGNTADCRGAVVAGGGAPPPAVATERATALASSSSSSRRAHARSAGQ